MPSVSKKQHNLMEAVAHNEKFAKKVGIPRSVGEDFVKADKGKSFKKGGDMKMKETMGPRNMSKDVEAGSNKHRKFGQSDVQKRGLTRGTNLGDSGKTEPVESEGNMKSFMSEMKKGGKVKKMAAGGMTKFPVEKGIMAPSKQGNRPHGEHADQERGHTRGMMPKMAGNDIGTGSPVNTKKKGGMVKKMASGGTASSRADGIAQKGKTRGKYC
jgi:hypothetical protein